VDQCVEIVKRKERKRKELMEEIDLEEKKTAQNDHEEEVKDKK
jgi:hypothetical protein